MDRDKLINIKEASEMLGVDQRTLKRWESSKQLIPSAKTKGGHRRYLLSEVQTLQGVKKLDSIIKSVAIYSRVSSNEQKQKGDLDRQKCRILDYCISKKYSVEYSFDEVGSGMSDKRPKLLKLLDLCIDGKIFKIIVEHKDRLSRFNINYLKKFFESHGVTLEIIEEILPKSYENELVEDILSLMSSFSAKIYGKRSAENRRKLNGIIN
jgi:predicted site-specific integrase-resolvase